MANVNLLRKQHNNFSSLVDSTGHLCTPAVKSASNTYRTRPEIAHFDRKSIHQQVPIEEESKSSRRSYAYEPVTSHRNRYEHLAMRKMGSTRMDEMEGTMFQTHNGKVVQVSRQPFARSNMSLNL
ncbi:hypothetical protein Ciccas_014148 [Cichlidogyrus casuarinus]|uniref:Uncharacterized protein n=1 Tax=Cichlidogyrus casuarinus TaxID=1844966 RepID=A0ABD2PKI4_9PLAT